MIRKVVLDALKPGMYVEDIGIHWIDAPYLYSRPGMLSSHREIDALRCQGFRYAYVDLVKSAPGSGDDAAQPSEEGLDAGLRSLADARGEDLPLVPLEAELATAANVYGETLQFVRNFYERIRQENLPSLEESQQYVSAIIDSTIRNRNALLNLYKLRAHDEYTYTHSVNVAILTVILGRSMGWGREEQMQLGTAALFHDIGKERIPQYILRKPGRLTDAEYRIVRRHPEEGYAMLQEQPGFTAKVLLPVLEHHEKHNGTGYPGGLAGDQIDPLSALVTIADIYDALSSDRIYKKRVVPQRALQILYAMRDDEIRSGLVEQFIKCLGVYPVGSLVRLNNGDYGVVTEVDSDRLLLPKIRIFLDEQRKAVQPRLVDLALCAERGEGISINACLDPREEKISVDR